MKKYKNKEFSVLMSCYWNDSFEKFRAALQSIVDNTLSPTVVVLVIDGPIPLSLENVISEYKDILPLIVVRLPENVGLALALNHGLKSIQTDYCIRADADDVNLPDRFSKILEKLTANYDLVGSYIEEYDPSDGGYVATKRVPLDQENIRGYAKRRNPFNHMSVGFNTTVVKRVGGYPSIHLREDYALWVTLLAGNITCCNIPDVLVHASAGAGMYERRGGITHIAAEFKMQCLLTELGYKGLFRAGLDFGLKTVVYLLPSVMRKYIYLYGLRN